MKLLKPQARESGSLGTGEKNEYKAFLFIHSFTNRFVSKS